MYQNFCSDIQVTQAIFLNITFSELTEWYQRLDELNKTPHFIVYSKVMRSIKGCHHKISNL